MTHHESDSEQRTPRSAGQPIPQTDEHRPGAAPESIVVKVRPPAPFATYGLLLLCGLAFLVVNVLGQGRELETFQFSVDRGQIWPGIVTYIFMHNDLMHLLGNLWVLYLFGRFIEWRYGSTRFLFLFFVAGIFGALAQAVATPHGSVIGASAAIAGVMAAFLRHYPQARLWLLGIVPLPAWVVLGAWLVSNVTSIWLPATGPLQIGFVAHVAGFAAGLVMSLALLPPGSAAARAREGWFEFK